MTILWLEGFDSWASSADGTAKGWIQNNAFLSTGRFGGQALGISTGGPAFLDRILPTPKTTLYVGAAFKFISTNIGTNNNGALFRFYGSDTAASLIVGLNSSGLLAILGSGWTGPGTVGTATINPGAGWTYLEVQVVWSTSATGTVKVWQDGTLIYSNTAIQTALSGHCSAFGQIEISTPYCSNGSNNSAYFDDLYGSDSAILGPIRVATTRPTSDNTGQGWTPSTGTTNYDKVNATIQNGGTPNVSASANSLTDLYGMGALPTSGVGAPIAVQPIVAATGAGNTISTSIKTGGTIYNSGTVAVPTAVNLIAPKIWEVNPNTGLAWTASDVNAMLVGMTNGAP